MRRVFLSICLLCCFASVAATEEVPFKGGVCRSDPRGGYVLDLGHSRLRVEANYALKGWRFSPVKGLVCKAKAESGNLALSFSAVAPKGFETQDGLPMLIVLSGDYGKCPNGLIRIAGKLVTSTSRNVWGYGDKIEFDSFRQTVKLSEPNTLSYWNLGTNGLWSLRVHTKGVTRADGSVVYAQTLTFATGEVKIARPIDMPALKRAQYLRQLSPPQEPPFDPVRWIDLCRRSDASETDLGRLEDLLDLRSALCSARDGLKHRPERDAFGEKLLMQGYEALNAMDVAGAKAAADALRPRMKDSAEWMPLARFSPYSWIKCYTQWGYVRAADGCSYLEPTPWCLGWQDGFRFSVAQDLRVALTNSKGHPRIFETLYREPMTDVKVDRDWVSDRWMLADGSRVTFSVLTPVVDVDGVDTLTLSGFPSEPDLLQYEGPAARLRYVRLTKEAVVEPEIVPSVLMDFKSPPPPPVLATRGTLSIDSADVARPWLMLSSKGGGWRLHLFPGARPVSVSWRSGVFTLRLERKSYVGVMRAMDNLQDCEQPALAEFFASVSAAYPAGCREEVAGRTCRWRYQYRVRPNAWSLKPRRIAPVPPLADLAGISVSGAKTVKQPTKWNLFKYVEGDSVAMELPMDLRREPADHLGVNVGYPVDVEKTDSVITNGARWVRLVCPRDPTITIARQCEKLAAALDYCRSRRVKVLLDAHNFNYKIDWSTGADPRTIANFYDVWDALSRIGVRYADVIEGYDLYNEPGLTAGSEGLWREICEKAGRIVRRNHPGAKLYNPAVYGGNPNGLFNLEPLGDDLEPQVVTYHFYSPHSFTHQKVDTQNRGNDVCNFYPSWIPPIDWTAENHWGGPGVTWHDRWTLAALLLPAFEHYALFGVPQHVGEFGVIGFANRKSLRSAYFWTRDAIDLFHHVGTSWHIWNGGFGLGNPLVREYVYGLWRKGCRR